MGFVFLVTDSGRIQSAGVCYVEGTLESGIIRKGSIGILEGVSGRRLLIKSVAFVCADPAKVKTLTLSVEEPNFSLSELVGRRLVGE
jgi:hypothetical protein